ncbi:MAG TPA: hypothetical protein VGF96_05885 [Terracidiphilus sp.]|jgi:hypothetical protein
MSRLVRRFIAPLLLLVSHALWATQFAYVQSAIAANLSSLAYTSNVSSGQILIAFSFSYSGSCGTSTTDTMGNSWYPLSLLGGSTGCAFYTVSAASGADTVSVAGLTGDYGLAVAAYSTSNAQYYIESAVIDSVTNTVSPSVVGSGSVVSGADSVEIMAVTFFWNQHGSYTMTSSPATLRQYTGGINGSETMAFADQDLTTSINPGAKYTNTFTGGSNDGHGTAIFLVAPVSSGGGGTVITVPVAVQGYAY